MGEAEEGAGEEVRNFLPHLLVLCAGISRCIPMAFHTVSWICWIINDRGKLMNSGHCIYIKRMKFMHLYPLHQCHDPVISFHVLKTSVSNGTYLHNTRLSKTPFESFIKSVFLAVRMQLQ